jgi:hypothetical protein
MKMAIITAHAGADTLSECLLSWSRNSAARGALVLDGTAGILSAYQRAVKGCEDSDILAYLHDDCRIDDPGWVGKVAREFFDPQVGLVGFGGALEHGTAGLYRDPYDYRQLGRAHFLSNMEDAEVHGKRFTGSCDVAVLDGFALIVRRKILEKMGGWPLDTPINYSLYDYLLSCETHRQGYRIRLVGVACKHYGGRTSVALGRAAGQGEAHELAHRWLYDNYRDVLPWRCK